MCGEMLVSFSGWCLSEAWISQTPQDSTRKKKESLNRMVDARKAWICGECGCPYFMDFIDAEKIAQNCCSEVKK